MKVIEVNTPLTAMAPLMYNVELVTGGYLTEQARIACREFEKFATLQSPDKVMFYTNEKDQVFSLHFTHTLDLKHTICAIDFFPEHSTTEVIKIANQLLAAMKAYWQHGHSHYATGKYR